MGQTPETTVPTVAPARTESAERRRSQRVQISIPVLVRGTSGSQPFEESSQTVFVNAHGCMVHLATPVVRAQQISIIHAKTAEEMPCNVVFVGKKDAQGITEVGMEFAEPAPVFWNISFPPDDWSLPEPKLADTSNPPVLGSR